MNNLFDKIKTNQTATRQARTVEYFAFLGGLDINRPSDADAAKLSAFLSDLGKTVADAERDHRAVADVLAMVGTVADNHGADAAYAKAHDAYEAAAKERQETFAALNERVRNANNDKDAAQDLLARYNAARGGLIRLREENPVVYAAIVEPKAKKLKFL